MKRGRLTAVSLWHYVRLFYRSAIFLLLLGLYLSGRWEESSPVLRVVWGVYAAEMIFRFFPFRYESPGSQKQFARNFQKTGKTEIIIQDNNAVMLVALVWVAFNGVFGALHGTGLLDDGFLCLLCGAYSVCDMICILFFCPFQTWFLKNRCCVTCRIYNWDFAMMFTPLYFIRRGYAWSLLALAVALLVRWEVTFFLHPERFSENSNQYLRCANCTEKLCAHKTQLRRLRSPKP